MDLKYNDVKLKHEIHRVYASGPYPLVYTNSEVSDTVIRKETQKVTSLPYSDNCCYTQILPMVKIISIIYVDPSHTFKAYPLKFNLFFPFVHLFWGDRLY
jgi:hypothetical protein